MGGILLFRPLYYRLVMSTVGLLDQMLDKFSDEDTKQQYLTQRLSRVLINLMVSGLSFVAIAIVIFGALLVYSLIARIGIDELEFTSASVIISMLIGSFLPIVPFLFRKKKSDYNELSVLLHQIVLNHKSLSLFLFKLEKRFFKRRLLESGDQEMGEREFVMVSGLARAGTTALTAALFGSGHFHSLSYANMPFLLSPNLWRLINSSSSSKKEKKERSHGDGVLFGVDSVEALEEYFWKAHLNDEYITDEKLLTHDVKEADYAEYILYQDLISEKRGNNGDTTYLAKNNNLVLRYNALRKINKRFKVILLFRDPVQHAMSLLNQHQRYVQMQEDDEFVKEYMTWLAHHEFGLEHRPFEFSEKVEFTHSPITMNYWIEQWINYYKYVLTLDTQNILFLDYADFLGKPNNTVNLIGEFLNKDFSDLQLIPFSKSPKAPSETIDEELLMQANQIYKELIKLAPVFE